MKLLSILVLVSPLANVDFGINKVLPDAKVVISKDVVIKAIDKYDDKERPDLDVTYFLGGAFAYGFLPVRFIVRALSKDHAHAIIKQVIDRLNVFNRIYHPDKGRYVFAVGEGATSSEIHEFVQSSDLVKGPVIFLDSGSIK
jgi:hypothetical protein